MRAALDSNVMIYAESLSDDPRCVTARTIVTQTDINSVIVPAQALAEMVHWLLKKARKTRTDAAESAYYWRNMFRIQPTTEPVLASAFEVMEQHNLSVFDSIILASAAEAETDMLLSEDMQNGFHWRGVTIVNPFAHVPHPLLRALVAS